MYIIMQIVLDLYSAIMILIIVFVISSIVIFNNKSTFLFAAALPSYVFNKLSNMPQNLFSEYTCQIIL